MHMRGKNPPSQHQYDNVQTTYRETGDSCIKVPVNPWMVTLSPGTAPLGGARISTLPGDLTHTTTAWDATPLTSVGFRLHSRTAMQFCNCMTHHIH